MKPSVDVPNRLSSTKPVAYTARYQQTDYRRNGHGAGQWAEVTLAKVAEPAANYQRMSSAELKRGEEKQMFEHAQPRV